MSRAPDTLPRPHEWRDDAACRDYGTDLWYCLDEHGQGPASRAAKRVCASCPVKAECLQDAFDHDERYGIWGGLSPAERERLTKHGQWFCEQCGAGYLPYQPTQRYCGAGCQRAAQQRRRYARDAELLRAGEAS